MPGGCRAASHPGSEPTQVCSLAKRFKTQRRRRPPGTVGCPSPRDHRFDAAVPELAAVSVVVIAAVGQQTVGTLPGAALARYRCGLLGDTKPSVTSMAADGCLAIGRAQPGSGHGLHPTRDVSRNKSRTRQF
jgi:hypothetical protein